MVAESAVRLAAAQAVLPEKAKESRLRQAAAPPAAGTPALPFTSGGRARSSAGSSRSAWCRSGRRRSLQTGGGTTGRPRSLGCIYNPENRGTVSLKDTGEETTNFQRASEYESGIPFSSMDSPKPWTWSCGPGACGCSSTSWRSSPPC